MYCRFFICFKKIYYFLEYFRYSFVKKQQKTQTQTHIAIFIVIFLWELTSATQISKYLIFFLYFEFKKRNLAAFTTARFMNP